MSKIYILYTKSHLSKPKYFMTAKTAKKHLLADKTLEYQVSSLLRYNELLALHHQKLKTIAKEARKQYVVVQTESPQEKVVSTNNTPATNKIQKSQTQPSKKVESLPPLLKNEQKLQISSPPDTSLHSITPPKTLDNALKHSSFLFAYFKQSSQPAYFDPKQTVHLYSDGCSKSNPGFSGAGYIAYQEGKALFQNSLFLGVKTNNQAEFMAFLFGIHDCFLKKAFKVNCYSDSQLLVRGILGAYDIKNVKLTPILKQIRKIMCQMQIQGVQHIKRQLNSKADFLANLAVDKYCIMK